MSNKTLLIVAATLAGFYAVKEVRAARSLGVKPFSEQSRLLQEQMQGF